MSEQCQKIIWEGRGRNHQCQNKASIQHDGKHYCTIHDPVRVAQQRKERDEKEDRDYQDKRIAIEAHARRQRIMKGVCSGISTELLEAHENEIKASIEKIVGCM